MLTAIVDADADYGIGKNGDLLFHIPEDMKFFRSTTLHHAVIMGRKTLDSLPNGKPFKDRRNIVLSRDESFAPEGVEVVHSVEEAVKLAEGEDEVFVCGGGEIYRQLLPYCQKVLITKIDAHAGAEVFFPDLDALPEWKLTECSEEHEHDGVKFRFCTYLKINSEL